MEIKTHHINNLTIAEIVSQDTVIQTVEDGTDLVGNLYYQGFDKAILYEENITPAFFDLKSLLAGEILQKFSNYRIGLVIVGHFTKFESKSLKDFIFESNKGSVVNFVKSIHEALSNSTII